MPNTQEIYLRSLIADLDKKWKQLSESEREKTLQDINLKVGRPANYHHLNSETQWDIDKSLGLLDA